MSRNLGLAPYAVSDTNSRGRRFDEPAPVYRGEFQRDRDRIVHSAAFRRLEYKTQVFVNHEGDLFRTRLTHSLEVAQIARSIARRLRLNEDLCEAISLAHDLGHTPFGHAGQDALNLRMRKWGGFEHNAQSVRVIDELEDKYAAFHGLNLMFETREGVLKHCSLKRARELGDIGERFILRRQASLEAQLANIADEIAYNNHDVDDGLRSQLLDFDALREVAIFDEHYRATIDANGTTLSAKQLRHETVRRIINTLVVDLTDASAERLREANPSDPDAVRSWSGPLIGFSAKIAARNRELKSFLNRELYQHHQVYRTTTKARRLVSELFDAFFADTRLLPPDACLKAQQEEAAAGEVGKARIVADYVAGMTDRFAIDEHERLFDLRRLR